MVEDLPVHQARMGGWPRIIHKKPSLFGEGDFRFDPDIVIGIGPLAAHPVGVTDPSSLVRAFEIKVNAEKPGLCNGLLEQRLDHRTVGVSILDLPVIRINEQTKRANNCQQH